MLARPPLRGKVDQTYVTERPVKVPEFISDGRAQSNLEPFDRIEDQQSKLAIELVEANSFVERSARLEIVATRKRNR